MTLADRIADALIDEPRAAVQAAGRALRALEALARLPKSTRVAHPREARRLALRASAALLELLPPTPEDRR